MRGARTAQVVCLGIAVCLLVGCAQLGWRFGERPLRLTDVRGEGDAARRASLQLVLEGLDADAVDDARRARGSYDRAIQVDPTNPYAYLALARHEVDGIQPDRALPFLDRVEALLSAHGDLSPGVEVHLIGLRGQAYYASGRIDQGVTLLEEARVRAPVVWSDGHLSAEELR
ncbi:MAG: hypothetical protein O7A09_00310 [Proteobacteria bacterium]|nr:hypothetical protein [Pseudomonadota bacterium]